MARALSQTLTRKQDRLRDLSRALPRAEELTKPSEQRFDAVAARLGPALTAATQAKRVQLERAGAPLRATLLAQQTAAMRTRLERGAELLDRALSVGTERGQARLAQVSRGLVPGPLQRELSRTSERFTRAVDMFAASASRQLRSWSDSLTRLDRMRESLGYQATLDRGYAVVWSGDQVITSKAAAKGAGDLEVQFKDGRHKLAVGKQPPKRKSSDAPEQSSLFDD